MENIVKLLETNQDKVQQFLIEAVVMLLLITILYFILKKNLFGPLGDILSRREARLKNAREGAEVALKGAEQKLHARDESLREARAEAAAFLDMGRENSTRDADAIVARARKSGSEKLEKASTELTLQTEKIRTSLERESHDLARLAVARLLGEGAQKS